MPPWRVIVVLPVAVFLGLAGTLCEQLADWLERCGRGLLGALERLGRWAWRDKTR